MNTQNKPFAFLDLDKTLYNGYAIVDLAIAQQSAGILPTDTLNELFRQYEAYKSGSTDLTTTAENALKTWGAGLEGISEEKVMHHAASFFKDHNKLFPFAHELIELLKEKSYEPMLVTGEPTFVAEAFNNILGLESYISSSYEVENGKYTGKILTSLGTSEGKHTAILSLGDTFPNSCAFGDSAGDIGMFELVDHAFCVIPDEELSVAAQKYSWNIVDGSNIISAVSKIL